VATNVGAINWKEWEASIEPRLFVITNLAELIDRDPPEPPVVIDGFLHKGSIANITGAMKTNKSWTLHDLAIALATGGEWLGRNCAKTKLLYFVAEIQESFWVKRFRILCDARGLDHKEVAASGMIQPVFIRGKDVSIKSLTEELYRWHAKGKLDDVGLIIIDPIYQLYEPEWQENRNEDMAKLGRFLIQLSEAVQVGAVFAHHHTKGNQEGKRDIEKGSGGGAFGRFVASNLAITHVGDEANMKFTLGWTTSHFPPSPKQVAVREGFEWVITDEDPKTAAKPKFTVD
jgi:RecA-family ATPase